MTPPGAPPGRHLRPAPEPASGPELLPAAVAVSRTGPASPVPGAGTVGPEPWPEHCRRRGARPRGDRWLVEAADAADLRGCGGAFFPAARKWRGALAGRGPVTVVVNAAESETLSAKDATLLRLRPHLVLDGLATLAETLDARSAVLWMHDSDHVSRRAVLEAVRERRRAGVQEVPVSLQPVPGGYLSGESSAIKQAIDGGPLLPRFRGAAPAAGEDSRSIVVHNVETLARLSLLSRRGVAAGAGATVRPEPAGASSRLLTVLTPRDRRVVEVPTTMRLDEVVTQVAGREPGDGSAVLLAGFGGVWARWADVADMPVAESAARARGLTLGPGIVAPLWGETCGVSATAAIAAYLARASARQCGPCLFGLPALAESMARLARGTARRGELAQLRSDLAAVDGRGACHHPDGAARLVRSSLHVFADDVAAHAARSPCGLPGDTIPVPEG